MKHFFSHFHFGNLATVFLIVLMMFAFVGVPSAFAVETSGWANLGDGNNPPDYSCGGGKSLSSFKIMDESTGLPAIVGKVVVKIVDASGATVISSSQTNVSETTPLCFDPTRQVAIWVSLNGNANYYDCGWRRYDSGEGYVGNCGGWAIRTDSKNQRIIGHIYVRPKSFPQQTQHHVSPISSVILNSNPSYTMELRDFPSNAVEGALTPSSLGFGVLDDATISSWIQTWYPISAKGTYTKGPFEIIDGWHAWGFSFTFLASDGRPVGAAPSDYDSFILDRAAPVVSTGISPAAPTSADAVTISGIAQDVLSGLSSITVYIDGQSKVFQAWPFGTTAKSSESVYVGPYVVGTTHSYYAVAKDRAGNVGTSATGSFTTLPATCTPTTISRCYLPATASGSSVGGSCSSGYSGSCNYTCTNGTWSQNSNSCTLSPTGTWTAPTCPTACGTAATNPPYSCIGGNGLCSTNTPATRSCAATSACVCPAPLNQNVTVACGTNASGSAATSGSVTRSQTKSAYPNCSFATPVTSSNSTYVSDNCVYPAPSGGITSRTCTIRSGGGACSMQVTWRSSDSLNTVTVKRPYDNNSIFATGISGDTPATFPSGTFALDLYDGTTKLASGSFTASCAAGDVWDGSLSQCRPIGVCGPASGSTPEDPQPVGAAACAEGTLSADSPADTATTWKWSCGAANTCTAPKYGCPVATDTNYNPDNTVNDWGCALTCKNGALSSSYSACNVCPADKVYKDGACVEKPTCTTSVSKSDIRTGDTVALTWACQHAASCTAITNGDGFSTGGILSGTDSSVKPSASSGPVTYGFTCDSTSFNFPQIMVHAPKIESFTANPTRVTAGNSSKISWSATDVNTCTVTGTNGFLKTGTTSGTDPVDSGAINSQTKFTIDCTTAGTDVTDSIVVNVTVSFQEF